ncbi:MAG: VrrA/YqfQ family protein [Lysinibacillus sp.]
MTFRPYYSYMPPPNVMRMPMQYPMPSPMRMPMSPQSFLPPNGFTSQIPRGLAGLGGQIPTPPVQAPSRISSFLQSADSLFNSAKTYTPYIQQAMPMMKNIPALFKMYKGFQGLPDAGAGADASAAADLASDDIGLPRRNNRTPNLNNQPISQGLQPSRPRIFQPPME